MGDVRVWWFASVAIGLGLLVRWWWLRRSRRIAYAVVCDLFRRLRISATTCPVDCDAIGLLRDVRPARGAHRAEDILIGLTADCIPRLKQAAAANDREAFERERRTLQAGAWAIGEVYGIDPLNIR